MANAAAVRAWANENGHSQSRGQLRKELIAQWNDAHPGDLYVPAPPRGDGFISDQEMDDLFPDVAGGAGGAAEDSGGAAPLAETRPRPLQNRGSSGRGAPGGGGGIRGLFGGGGTAKDRGRRRQRQRPARVSTESLLGAVWRGAAKLAAPLPPLYRTLRVQAPVAGPLLEDAVRESAVDAILQPFARLAGTGKVVSALLGPPVFVTGITLHVQQRAAAGEQPHPLFMAMAQEGLRSSLMAMMDIAGPKFAEAIEREKEFEETYGKDVDRFMDWLFSPPPATADEAEEEERMFAWAMHAPAGAAV